MKPNKNIILGMVLVLIVLAIVFLEKKKSPTNLVDELNIDWDINNPDEDFPISENAPKRILDKANKYPRAKELVSPGEFINTDYINISSHIGKDIILVDFWTYSCINCQRTLPYITKWWDKYKDQGLIIIGVHTPEFDFEKEYDNVFRATQKWDVDYPVVLDNDYLTWRAYKNRYWPRKYIIDIDGFIVYDHIGEGKYAETEKVIQDLLKERNEVLSTNNDISTGLVKVDDKKSKALIKTQEIYFGYGYDKKQIGNAKGLTPEQVTSYILPEKKERDKFYLEGDWLNQYDYMQLMNQEGKIYLDFTAREVNIVAQSINSTKLKVLLDGKHIKNITINNPDLYNIIELESSGQHSLEIVGQKGLRAFTFTFG